MKKIIYTILFLSFLSFSFGQSQQEILQTIDSLHQKGSLHLRDSGYYYYIKAKVWIQRLQPSTEKNNREAVNGIRFYEYYKRESKFEKVDSIINVLENTLASNDTLYFFVLSDKAMSSVRKGDMKNALAQLLKLKKLVEEKGEYKWVANTHFSLGYYYGVVNDHQKALYHKKKALKMHELEEDYGSEYVSKVFYIAPTYFMLGMKDSAIYSIKKAISMDENAIVASNGIKVYNNIALMYHYDSKPDSANYYITKLINGAQRLKDSINLSYGYSNRAEFFLSKGEYGKAKKNIDSAHLYFYPIIDNVTLFRIRGYYRNKMEIEMAYDKVFNTQSANKTFREFNSVISDKYNAKINTEIEELKASFEREKQLQQEQAGLKKKQNILFGILTLILVLAGFGFLFYRNRRQKEQIEKISIEHRLLRGQMNPHFMFNALATLNTLIEDEKKKEAQKYLSDFSGLMRGALELTSQEVVSLHDETAFIEKYLEIQKKRNPGVFEYSINENTQTKGILIPPLILQPFVENAVKYAFTGKNKTGKIDIDIAENANQYLSCRIKDDGKGFSQQNDTVSKSYSTDITRKRLKDFAKNLKKKYGLEIKSKPGKGVEVEILLPFEAE